MDVNEKIALYEFCRNYFHKEFYDLKEDEKAAVTIMFSKVRIEEELSQVQT